MTAEISTWSIEQWLSPTCDYWLLEDAFDKLNIKTVFDLSQAIPDGNVYQFGAQLEQIARSLLPKRKYRGKRQMILIRLFKNLNKALNSLKDTYWMPVKHVCFYAFCVVLFVFFVIVVLVINIRHIFLGFG